MTHHNDQSIDPRQIAEELGPFSPPDNFSFGPEFEPGPPRPIPRHLRQGSYDVRRHQIIHVTLGIGLFCLAASTLSFVKELGYYILPLGYLNWIAYAIIGFSALAIVCNLIVPGRYVYVRKGWPLIGRVLQSGYHIECQGYLQEFCFATMVEYRHPESDQIDYTTVLSPKMNTTPKELSRYTSTLKQGYYVTAVYLPDKFDKSLQIYGYLGLNPDVDFIRKDGKPITKFASIWKTLAVIIGVVVFLILLMGFINYIMFRFPIEDNWAGMGVGVLAVSIATGLICLFAAPLLRKKDKSRRPLKWLMWGTLAGALLGLFIPSIINSALDFSEPEFREVEIIEFWQSTYDYIIRDYEIEFRELDSSESHKYPARLDYMDCFRTTMSGAIEVHEGVLGWPWIRQIYPIVLVRIAPEAVNQTNVSDSNKQTSLPDNKTFERSLALGIMVNEREFRPVSDNMSERIWSKLQENGTLTEVSSENADKNEPSGNSSSTLSAD